MMLPFRSKSEPITANGKGCRMRNLDQFDIEAAREGTAIRTMGKMAPHKRQSPKRAPRTALATLNNTEKWAMRGKAIASTN